jgi:hypothetical protein
MSLHRYNDTNRKIIRACKGWAMHNMLDEKSTFLGHKGYQTARNFAKYDVDVGYLPVITVLDRLALWAALQKYFEAAGLECKDLVRALS